MRILCGCVLWVLILCVLTEAETNTSNTTEASVPVDETQGAAPLNNDLLPDNSLCGLQVLKNRTSKNITEVDEFPWVVALRYVRDNGGDGGFLCSGTLISEKYVVTSAECLRIEGFTLNEVRLGQWNVSNINNCFNTHFGKTCSQHVVDVRVVKQIQHPFYNPKLGGNNIALLRLEQSVKYTDNIRAICLPPNEYPLPLDHVRMDTAGWRVSKTGELVDVKLRLTIAKGAQNKCAEAYPNRTYVNIYQACVETDETKYECNLSSGSPVMRMYYRKSVVDEEQFFQEGIISRRLNCDKDAGPSLFTRVPSYVNWILNNMDE